MGLQTEWSNKKGQRSASALNVIRLIWVENVLYELISKIDLNHYQIDRHYISSIWDVLCQAVILSMSLPRSCVDQMSVDQNVFGQTTRSRNDKFKQHFEAFMEITWSRCYKT